MLARVFIAVCLLMALAEFAFSNAWLGLFLLVAAAGVYAAAPLWLGAMLVTLGAIVGGMMLVWTIIGALLALVLVVLCTIDARRAV